MIAWLESLSLLGQIGMGFVALCVGPLVLAAAVWAITYSWLLAFGLVCNLFIGDPGGGFPPKPPPRPPLRPRRP